MERPTDRGVIKLTATQEVNHLGQNVEVFLVNERDSYVVVAQLSPEFATAIVDHWRILKDENADLKAHVASRDVCWTEDVLTGDCRPNG